MEAMRRLCEIKMRQIPDDERLRFAQIARKLGLPLMALHGLYPLMHPGRRKKREPTPWECAEYAGSLVLLGEAREALEIARSLDAENFPEVSLLTAFAQFTYWQYAEAIPNLEKYLTNASLTPFQKLMGQVNLAAAFVYERRPDSLSLLQQVQASADQQGYVMLSATLLTMQSEAFLSDRNFTSARDVLKQAKTLLVPSQLMENLLIDKWIALTDLYVNPNRSSVRHGIIDVRKRATQLRHWETLRSCDYHEAIARKDGELLPRTYFGSPFPSFRKRLVEEFGAVIDKTAPYEWVLGSDPAGPVVDFSDVKGSLPQRACRILQTDFYCPMRLAPFYFHLRPERTFDPIAAPKAVHDVILRMKQWFRKQDLPLDVEEKSRCYRLIPKESCVLRVRLDVSNL